MNNFFTHFCIISIAFITQALGSEAGMPQLNPEFWISQIFWLLLIFATLYLVIWKIFLPKITYSIENRKSKIVNDLDEAQKLKDNAEKKLNEYKEIIEKSKKDAKKVVEDGKKLLDRDIESKKQKINNQIEIELKNAEKEIKDLTKSSLENISIIASDISSEVLKQMLSTEVNKSNVNAIVNDLAKKEMAKYS
jgi:F-type H+-transporting ATPase subunit b